MTASIDRALLRFLRARVDGAAVLNDVESRLPAGVELPSLLADCATAIRRAAVSPDGHVVAYARLRSLPEYRSLQALTPALNLFDPGSLADRPAQLAFWLNLYNTLTIDAVLRFELEGTIRRLPGFFRQAAYRVGGLRFSAEEIEHGVLRGNRPPLAGLPAPFSPSDRRRALVIDPPDPRVHFAMNCGTRSCPAWRAYDADSIDRELEHATRHFVAESVRVEGGQLLLSPLFSLYMDDFGGAAGLGPWLAAYVEPNLSANVVDLLARGAVTFTEYDWALNSLPAGVAG